MREAKQGTDPRHGVEEVRARLQDPAAGQQRLGASGQPWRPARHRERELRVQEKERREGGTEGEGLGSAWNLANTAWSLRAGGPMGAEELHSFGSNREEEVVCGFGGDRGILEGAS